MINYLFEIIIRVKASVNGDALVEVGDILAEFFTMGSRDALIDVVEGIRGIGETTREDSLFIHITCSSMFQRKDRKREEY